MRTVLLWLLLTSPAWAATTFETTKAIRAGALTSEMKALVPALEGLDMDTEKKPGVTILTIRRLTGEFSPSEVALLTQALGSHDASKLPVNPDKELDEAITAVDTSTIADPSTKAALESLKGALLGKVKAGKIMGKTP